MRPRSIRSVLVGMLLALLSVTPAAAEVEEVEHYDSLDAMSAASDAVVLGRIETVVPGRVFSGCGNAAAGLRIERVLAGSVPLGAATLTVEYFGFCGPPPVLGGDIPAERGVFFLRNKAEDQRMFGGPLPAAAIEAERPFWRTVVLAGTVLERAGRVHVPKTLNAAWLAEWEGKPFEAFLDVVGSGSPDVGEPGPGALVASVPPWAVPGALAAVVIAVGAVLVALGGWRRSG